MASELDDYVTALAAVNTGEKSPRVSVGLVTQQEPQAAPSELDQYVTGLGKARPDAAAQIAETKNPWEMDLGAPAQSSPTADAKQPKASERTWWQASDDMWHHFDAGAYIAVRDALHGIGKLNESHRLSQLEYEKKRPSIFRLLGMPSFADRPSLLEWVGPESDTYKALSGMAEGNLLDVTDVQKQREQQAQQQIEAARKQGGELSGFLEAGKQNLTNPSILVDNVAGMMPALGATIATTAVNPVLGATTGAAIFGGGAASGTYEAVYQAARDQGMTEDQARAAAQDSSNRAGMVGALVGAGGTLIGPAASIAGRSAPALSTVIANAAKNPLAAGALTAGKDLAAGEAMTLAPHIAQNVEVGKIDGQTPWYQDVGPVAGQTAATFLPISLAGGARATRDASKLRQARTEARDATQEAARQPEQTEAQRPPETQDRAQERDQAKAAPGRFDYGDYGKYRDALESGRMGDDAANTNSSALGRHQFVDGTWLDLIGRYKPEWADGLTRAELLELRKDQAKSAEMVAHFDQENAQALRLDGMPVTNETLYASHHFGPGKGVQFAKAGGDTPMADILTPGQMRANPYLDGLTKDQAIANWNRRAGKAGTDVAAGEARAAARAERGPADESARVAEREAGPEADLAVEAEPPKAEADDALPSMAREDVAGEAEIPETPTPTERAAQAEPQDRAARRQAQDGGEPADAVSQETTPAAQDAPNPVQAALARIANGEGVRDVLAGMPDAVARDTANAMGRDFAETAKAPNIAEFMGKLPASDLAQRAQRAVVVQDPVKALRELAEMARTNGNENKTVTLGVVSDKLASVLRGQNVPVDSGFTHTADMFAVRHAINRHGDAKVEKAQGQLALTASDVASFHSAINRPDAYIIGAKNPRKQDVVGYLKRLSDGNLLYLEEVRTGRRSLAMASARKYPGTTDFETIRNRIVPSYARSDTGDVRIVYQDGGRGQAAATAAGAVTDSKATGHLGRDSVPLSEGGKPFKTRAQAAQAKAMQPSMRVVRADGGWALANKTPAQLAAQAKAARRLAMASTGKAGQPIAAHEFIAGEGGLSRAVASDLGVEGNPRVGNRWLYAGKGKGLTIEQATEKLREAGYIRGDSHNEALDVIRRSLKEPQYTPEGWDRIAEAEAQTRFEDHLAARQEEMGDTELAREQALEDHAKALGDEAVSDDQLRELADKDIVWDAPSNASHEDAMRALGFTGQEIQNEIAQRSGRTPEDSQLRGVAAEDEAGAPERLSATRTERARSSDSKTPDVRQADVATGDAKLTSYSESDLRQREQKRQTAETERQRQEKDAAQRAQADAERGDFTLTGSDRPADEAEARGQRTMFSRGKGETAEDAQTRALIEQYAGVDGAPTASEIARARQQWKDTERSHGGRPTYDKAKADGKTNLTYPQWVTVRTPNFKRWFGDWQALAHREFLDGDAIATLKGDEFKPNGEPLTTRVPRWWAEHGDATVETPGVGDVTLDAKAVKNSLSHGIGADKAAAFAAVPDVLRHGRVVHSEPMTGSTSGGMVYHVAAPIEIGGRQFVADVMVKADNHMRRMYVHEVALKEALRQSAFKTSAVAAWTAGKRSGADAGAIRSVLENIYAVKGDGVSRVVDPKTGEPLVVYHATDNDFSAFDFKRAGENTDIRSNDKEWAETARVGAWFSTKELTGSTAQSVSMPVFLAIRNPKNIGSLQWLAERAIPMHGDGKAGEYRAHLESEGHDGITVEDEEFGGTSYVAFKSAQIKSAIGNAGTFDVSSADVRFSRGKGETTDDALTEQYAGLAALNRTMRRVRGSDQAKEVRDQVVGRQLTNIETGITATVSGESWRKMMSKSNVDRSVSSQAHMQALGNLDHLFRLSTLEQTRPGKKAGDAGRVAEVQHFVVPMPFDGEVLQVRILAKRYVDQQQGNRLYLVEAVEIGTPASFTGESASSYEARSPHRPAGVDSSFAQMVAAVKRGAGMPHEAVQSIVDAIKGKWKNAPEVVVARNMADERIPQAVREQDASQRSQGASGNVEGFFHEGKVYVLADHLASPADVARVVLHESVGHYGLRGVFGEKLGAVLDQLAWQRRGELAAKARKYGLVPDHVPEDALPGRVYDAMDTTSRRIAAEEMLADLAEKQPQIGFVKRAVAEIRTWLRKNVPGFEKLKLSDAEIIRDIIIPARRFVERGEGSAPGETMFSRAQGGRGLPNDVEPVFDYRNDIPLKSHPDYKAAKAGDMDAAARLVRDMVKPESLEASRKLGPDVIYVPVHAEEATGKNKIPNMLAMEHAKAAGALVDSSIVQTNKAFHTGAGPMERLMNRAEFAGKVEPGKRYVLVDDVTTMGSTLADLAAYIQRNGGKVEGARLLVNAARGGKIAASPKVINELDARHGQAIRDTIGIAPDQLTGPESQYLIGFKSADELRNRSAKAGQERIARLRAKEILPERAAGVDENAAPKDSGVRFKRTEDDDLPQEKPATVRTVEAEEKPESPRAPGESHEAWQRRLMVGRKGAMEAAVKQEALAQRDIGRGLMRAMWAKRERSVEQAQSAFREATRYFDKAGEQASLDAIDQYETGGVAAVTDAAAKPFFAAMDKGFEQRVRRIRELAPDAMQHLIEHYFPHLWEDPTKAAKWYQSVTSKRPLQGDRSFLKQRTHGTIKEGMATGLKPISTNPVDHVLAKMAQMDKFITFLEMRDDLKARGWLKQVKAGERMPEGYALVDDPAFKGQHAFIIKGENGQPDSAATSHWSWAMPEMIARDVNNYLSPSLYRFSGFKAFRTIQNTMMSARLGWSAFHAGFTTLDNLVTHFDVGARRLLIERDIGGGLKTLAGSLMTPFTSPWEGGKLNKMWMGKLQADPNTYAILEALEQGGARMRMSATEHNAALMKMRRAIDQGSKSGMLKNILPAVGELSSWVIHHKLVPAQKMSARVLLMKYELDSVAGKLGRERGDYAGILSDMHPDAIRQIAGRVVDTVDNRLGQMTYDNQFWNKTARECAQVGIGAVGWQVGTVRTVTGALRDIKNLAMRTPDKLLSPLDVDGRLTGEHLERTANLTYFASLAIVMGGMGATLQYMLTGSGPDELKDYFFPKTGRTNPDGTDERVSFPSYWMDHYKLATHPIQTASHKIHPVFSVFLDTLTNKDYFGNKVRDEDAPWAKQAAQVGKYLAAGFLPYSAKNAQEMNKTGTPPAMMAASFFGVAKAPASVSRTTFQAFVAEHGHGSGSMTPDQAENSQARRDAIVAMRQGETPDLANFSPAQKQRMRAEARQDPTVVRFNRLSLTDKLRAWDRATDAERERYKLRALILRSYANSFAHLPPEQKQEARQRIDAVRGWGRESEEVAAADR